MLHAVYYILCAILYYTIPHLALQHLLLPRLRGSLQVPGMLYYTLYTIHYLLYTIYYTLCTTYYMLDTIYYLLSPIYYTIPAGRPPRDPGRSLRVLAGTNGSAIRSAPSVRWSVCTCACARFAHVEPSPIFRPPFAACLISPTTLRGLYYTIIYYATPYHTVLYCAILYYRWNRAGPGLGGTTTPAPWLGHAAAACWPHAAGACKE